MKNEPLFELIKGMSQTEKTHFKRYSKSHSAKKVNYLNLYELIGKQDEYNELSLKKELGSTHFAQNKKHLYLKVLESLRNYHSKHYIESQIYAHLNNFEILFSKSLLKPAKKELSRAKTLALKYERLSDLIKIGKYEGQVFKNENDLNQLEEHFKSYLKTTSYVNTSITIELKVENLHLKLVQWNKSIEWVRNDGERDELIKIIKSFSFNVNDNYIGRETLAKYYYAKGICSYLTGDFEHSFIEFKNQLSVFEANPWLKKDESSLVKVLGNISLLSIITKNKKFNKYKNALNELVCKDPLNIIHQDYLKKMIYLMFLCRSERYMDAANWLEINNRKISDSEKIIMEKNILYNEHCFMTFYKINAYLGVRNIKMALKIINNYLVNAKQELKQDTYCLARIINLLIHFELDNTDLLDYELSSTYNYLKNKKRLYLFEEILTRFIKKAINRNSNIELNSLLLDLHSDLEELKIHPYEKVVFEFFDFVAWTERNIIKLIE